MALPPLRELPRTLACLCAASFVPVALGAAPQTPQQLVGYERLAARLGPGNFPTGAGVSVGQVEAPSGGAYAPDPNHPEFAGKIITLRSGGSAGASGHATVVGQYWFGLQTSIAPGIGIIDAFEANHWLGAGFLNGSGAIAPVVTSLKIFNHSWIGSAGGANNAFLRKLDYAIDAQGLIVCAGVNNGSGPLDVALLSQAFHVIAVGRSDGSHHAGGTALGIDGPGRMKPELVAPAGATSFSTPLVAGAAALLVETARSDPNTSGNPDAERPDVIKAVLMTGAEHRSGWSNLPVTTGALRGATATPLDSVFGADQIDVDAAHWILSAGEQPAATDPVVALDSRPAGWSEVDIDAGQSRWLHFSIEARKPTVVVTATWHRSVPGNFTSSALSDLDLELWAVDAQGLPSAIVGSAPGAFFGGGNVLSDSAVDNVEHLYVTDLEPGDYLLELRRAQDALPTARAAVAWHFVCAATQPYGSPKPSSIQSLPTLRSTGMPSLFGDDFELTVSDGVPQKVGLMLRSFTRGNLPFGGGTLLVGLPFKRLGPLQLDVNGAGSFRVPVTPDLVGRLVDFQFWFRDPQHPDGTGVGLTDALEVQFCR